jgi:hypothetical protein
MRSNSVNDSTYQVKTLRRSGEPFKNYRSGSPTPSTIKQRNRWYLRKGGYLSVGSPETRRIWTIIERPGSLNENEIRADPTKEERDHHLLWR